MAQELAPVLTAATKKAMQKHLQELEEAMTPECANLLAWSRKWLEDGTMLTFKRVWALGGRLNKAMGDAAKYGAKVVDNLAECLGIDKSTLYKAAHFHRDFDEPALTRLIELRLAGSGSPITMPHVYELMTITDAKVRDSFLKKTADNCWSPTELGAAIRGHLNRPAHAGGRSVKVPATLGGKLDNLDKVLAVYNRNHTVIYANDEHGIIAAINDMPPDRVTADLVQKFDASIVGLQQARDNIDEELKLVRDAKEIAVTRLAAQSQQDAAADAIDMQGAD